MPKNLFQPGNNLNPGGRPRLSDELRAIRKLSRDEVKALMGKFARMTVTDAEKYLKIKELTLIEKAIIENLLDKDKLGFILDQTLGKVKEEVQVNLVRPVTIVGIEGEPDIVLDVEQLQLPEGEND